MIVDPEALEGEFAAEGSGLIMVTQAFCYWLGHGVKGGHASDKLSYLNVSSRPLASNLYSVFCIPNSEF